MIYPMEKPENLGYSDGRMLVHLGFDADADYADLPGLDKVAPGSDALCVETSKVYILCGDTDTWEEL